MLRLSHAPRLLLSTLLALAATAAPGSARAEPPRLELPVTCAIGRDCWVIQYVDHDPGPAWRDYACGARGYDGHGGTDIGLAHAGRVAAGVPVVASAPGVVAGVRDGEPDGLFEARGAQAVAGRECGNGVRVDHGDGWQTLYCHLRQGSITVQPGQRVAAGDRLGDVGLSGAAAFPHVELTVLHGQTRVDPFTGEAGPGETCDTAPRAGSLWTPTAAAALDYTVADIVQLGLAGAVPEQAAVRSGALAGDTVAADAPALLAWTEVYGVRAGDRLRMTLTGPDGAPVVTHEETLERTQIRIYRHAGRKRTGGPWPVGDYVATVELTRPGSGTVGRSETLRVVAP